MESAMLNEILFYVSEKEGRVEQGEDKANLPLEPLISLSDVTLSTKEGHQQTQRFVSTSQDVLIIPQR